MKNNNLKVNTIIPQTYNAGFLIFQIEGSNLKGSFNADEILDFENVDEIISVCKTYLQQNITNWLYEIFTYWLDGFDFENEFDFEWMEETSINGNEIQKIEVYSLIKGEIEERFVEAFDKDQFEEDTVCWGINFI